MYGMFPLPIVLRYRPVKEERHLPIPGDTRLLPYALSGSWPLVSHSLMTQPTLPAPPLYQPGPFKLLFRGS